MPLSAAPAAGDDASDRIPTGETLELHGAGDHPGHPIP
jgi:hypothetical protein